MSCTKYVSSASSSALGEKEPSHRILAIRRSPPPNPSFLIQMRLKRRMSPSGPGRWVHGNDILMSHEDLLMRGGRAR